MTYETNEQLIVWHVPGVLVSMVMNLRLHVRVYLYERLLWREKKGKAKCLEAAWSSGLATNKQFEHCQMLM